MLRRTVVGKIRHAFRRREVTCVHHAQEEAVLCVRLEEACFHTISCSQRPDPSHQQIGACCAAAASMEEVEEAAEVAGEDAEVEESVDEEQAPPQVCGARLMESTCSYHAAVCCRRECTRPDRPVVWYEKGALVCVTQAPSPLSPADT